MSLDVKLMLGDQELAALSIDRLESLKPGQERYRYQALLSSKEWREGRPVITFDFKSTYHHGSLVLVQKAIAQLLKQYPELRAGRFGIPRNRAKCRKCGTVAWSIHGHDFSSCRCGAIAVDGGYEYCRRIGKRRDFVEMQEDWQKKPKLKTKAVKKTDIVFGPATSPFTKCKHGHSLVYCIRCAPSFPGRWIGSELHERLIGKERKRIAKRHGWLP